MRRLPVATSLGVTAEAVLFNGHPKGLPRAIVATAAGPPRVAVSAAAAPGVMTLLSSTVAGTPHPPRWTFMASTLACAFLWAFFARMAAKSSLRESFRQRG